MRRNSPPAPSKRAIAITTSKGEANPPLITGIATDATVKPTASLAPPSSFFQCRPTITTAPSYPGRVAAATIFGSVDWVIAAVLIAAAIPTKNVPLTATRTLDAVRVSAQQVDDHELRCGVARTNEALEHATINTATPANASP